MTSRSRRLCQILFFALLDQAIFAKVAFTAEAMPPSDWEKIVKAAEQEGEVAYSASGSARFLEEFHKAFPKIKTTVVSASCNDVGVRLRGQA